MMIMQFKDVCQIIIVFTIAFKDSTCDEMERRVVEIGDEIELDCGQDEDGIYLLMKDNEQVNNKLQIRDPSDAGIYQCYSYNSDSGSSELLKTYKINVKHMVSGVESTGGQCRDDGNATCVDIKERNDVTLECNATDGYPDATVDWYVRAEEENRDIPVGIHGRALVIRNISYHCDSVFVCKVGNDLNGINKVQKTIKVLVGREPKVLIKIKRNDGEPKKIENVISVCPQEAIRLICLVNTFPAPDEIKWIIHNDNSTFRISTKDDKNFISSESNACTASIDSIEFDSQKDSNKQLFRNATIFWKNIRVDCVVGNFTCEAVNTYGNSSKTHKIVKGNCTEA